MCGYDAEQQSQGKIFGVETAVQNLRRLRGHRPTASLPSLMHGWAQLVTLCTPLLAAPDPRGDGSCQNKGRHGLLGLGKYELKNYYYRDGCSGGLLFATLWWASRCASMRQCRDAQCHQRRLELMTGIPECIWSAFSQLVLTALACRCYDFLQEIQQCVAASLSEEHVDDEEPPYSCVDVLGVVDVLRWALRIAQMHVQDSADFKGSLYNHLPTSVYRKLSTLTNRIHPDAVCPNRLWNLAEVSGLGTADLPALAAVAQPFNRLFPKRSIAEDSEQLGSLQRETLRNQRLEIRHQQCTEQVCTVSSDNSTLVTQAHKCSDGKCDHETQLPVHLLNEIYDMSGIFDMPHKSLEWEFWTIGRKLEWRQTAWSLGSLRASPFLCGNDDAYMAISHVWSDGTGVGRKSAGFVNTCLLEFFAYSAVKLGCTGIWWDAISLPTSREERRAAIAVMLQNYEKAKVTVIHDAGLLDFQWRDDGSPAVALVLSAWFTRGWTAAELFASSSHPVKILFKNPDPTGPPLVMKDLDADVLAFDNYQLSHEQLNSSPDSEEQSANSFYSPGTAPKLGYFVASDLIRRFRRPKHGGEESSLPRLSAFEDLLEALRGRSTSWSRDYLIIAALMCSEDPTNVLRDSDVAITRGILQGYGSIRIKDLYHAEIPQPYPERWSWCPPSVHCLGKYYRQEHKFNGRCDIDTDGTLTGVFSALPLRKGYKLTPIGVHAALSAKIAAACLNRRTCLLLTHGIPERRKPCLDDRIFIFATALKDQYTGSCPLPRVTCEWIACVRLTGCSSELSFWKEASLVKASFGSQQLVPGPPLDLYDLDLFSEGYVLTRIEPTVTLINRIHKEIAAMYAADRVSKMLNGLVLVNSVLSLMQQAIRAEQVDSLADEDTAKMGRLITSVKMLKSRICDTDDESPRDGSLEIPKVEQAVANILSNLETFSMHVLGTQSHAQTSIRLAKLDLLAPTESLLPDAAPDYSSMLHEKPSESMASEKQDCPANQETLLNLLPINEVVGVGETFLEMKQNSTFEATASILLQSSKRNNSVRRPAEIYLHEMLRDFTYLVAGDQFAMHDVLVGLKNFLLLMVLQSLEPGDTPQRGSERAEQMHANLFALAEQDSDSTIPTVEEVRSLIEQITDTGHEQDTNHALLQRLEERSWPFEFLARQSISNERLLLFGANNNLDIGKGPFDAQPGDELCKPLGEQLRYVLTRRTGAREAFLVGCVYVYDFTCSHEPESDLVIRII